MLVRSVAWCSPSDDASVLASAIDAASGVWPLMPGGTLSGADPGGWLRTGRLDGAPLRGPLVGIDGRDGCAERGANPRRRAMRSAAANDCGGP
jgi:hypothetical protein